MQAVSSGHPGVEALLDVLEGGGAAEVRAHAAVCLHCRARLDQAGAGLEAAVAAEVPEPSPLFWESFRRQVGSRIEAGPSAPRWRSLLVSPWLAAAAAALVAVALMLPRAPAPPAPSGQAAVLPAWSPLPPAEEDAGLELLAVVVPGTADLGPLTECQGLGDCMEEAAALSDEETAALAEALRRELGVQS